MSCYICQEDTEEVSQCVCKARVHAGCLLECIRRSRSPKCTICQGPIANVRLRARRRLSRFVGCFVALLCASLFACALASLLLLALAVEEKRVHEFYELLIGCTSAVGWALVASSCLQKILHDHELVAEYEEYEYCATGNRLASTWPPRASA